MFQHVQFATALPFGEAKSSPTVSEKTLSNFYRDQIESNWRATPGILRGG